MHIEIEVRVVKSIVWALKNYNLEARGIAWTSECTEECTYRRALVTENWLGSCIMQFLRIHSQLTMISVSLDKERYQNSSKSPVLKWNMIQLRIRIYLEQLGLLHTVKCTLTYLSLLCSGRSSTAYARVNHREHTNFPYPSQLEGILLTVFPLFNIEIHWNLHFVNFPKFEISIKCCIWYHRSWASLIVLQMRGKISKKAQ